MRIGFDNDKYIALQAEHIRERIGQFGGKLYLEFGGKLFDDHHASRVLPGFQPDSKIRMLKQFADDVEIIVAINANDIEKTRCAATWASPTTKTCCACSIFSRTWALPRLASSLRATRTSLLPQHSVRSSRRSA